MSVSTIVQNFFRFLHQLKLRLESSLRNGWNIINWFGQVAGGDLKWLANFLGWWLRQCLTWLSEAASGLFNQDLKLFNRILAVKSSKLEVEWANGAGHIDGEEVFSTLSDDQLAWAWQVIYDEHRHELDRWTSRIDRSSAVATSASVVLAVILGMLTPSVVAPHELTSHFQPFNLASNFLMVLSRGFCVVSFVSLLRCIYLSIGVLETDQSLQPSFAQMLDGSAVPGSFDRARRIASGRLLLYAAARNSLNTSRRYNMLDAAVRHQQDGLASLVGAGAAWATHLLLNSPTLFYWFEN